MKEYKDYRITALIIAVVIFVAHLVWSSVYGEKPPAEVPAEVASWAKTIGVFLVRLSPLGSLALGAFYLIRFRRLSREMKQSAGWAATTGAIVRSERLTEFDHEGNSYKVELQYAYRVGQQDYAGTRITLDDQATGESADADEDLKRFPVGRHVTVYYDPTSPDLSVLERKVSKIWAYPVLGVPAVIGAFVLPYLIEKYVVPKF